MLSVMWMTWLRDAVTRPDRNRESVTQGGDLQAAVNARIVPAGWRDEARDIHGTRIEVGDRVRWISQPGDSPGGSPRPGATGYAKAIYNPAAVWFWLDEPTGTGPGGEYWDTNPWRLERI